MTKIDSSNKYYLLKTDVKGLYCSKEFLFDPESMMLYVYDEENGNYDIWDSCKQQLIEK